MIQHRRSKIGALGEDLAHELLAQAGFDEIKNLNQLRQNHPCADFTARRGGRLYLISVKARNRYQASGPENPEFNLAHHRTEEERETIAMMEREMGASFAFVAIQIEPRDGVFSAYFGTWDQIGHRLAIPMREADTASYECLALRRPDARIGLRLDNRRNDNSAPRGVPP